VGNLLEAGRQARGNPEIGLWPGNTAASPAEGASGCSSHNCSGMPPRDHRTIRTVFPGSRRCPAPAKARRPSLSGKAPGWPPPLAGAGTGSAAAASGDTPGRTGARCSAAAMNCPAQAPWSCSGSESVATWRSLGSISTASALWLGACREHDRRRLPSPAITPAQSKTPGFGGPQHLRTRKSILSLLIHTFR
jgi:hypothetical protein